ncbi:MAG TPA: hypothetical protein PLW86_09575, partial [Rhodocyclaceae bacterium]|nr:hypothetical protein [Rhodocyclaceae bacterium]
MAPRSEPVAQPRGCFVDVGTGNADGRESQSLALLFDLFGQRRSVEVQRGVASLPKVLHTPHVTAEFDLPDEAATQRLGALLGPLLQPGMVVAF